jgi:O-acetyl-ADP-ribose deacetylase (regulator of RNase III)
MGPRVLACAPNMPTAFIKGDLFEAAGTTGPRAFAFGANTDGTMDLGIAIAMMKRWPAFADAYAKHCAGGKVAPGDTFMWTEGEVTVFALGIQHADKKPSFGALHTAVRRMLTLAAEAKLRRIHVARLGVGEQGLDWTRVRKMLGEVTVNQVVRLDVFEQFIRAAPKHAPTA